MKTKIASCHTADSEPVKQEVNGTVILPWRGYTGCCTYVNVAGNGLEFPLKTALEKKEKEKKTLQEVPMS
jgi:hypothetical protein